MNKNGNNRILNELKCTLKEEYYKNPKKVSKYMRRSLYNIGVIKDGKKAPVWMFVCLVLVILSLLIGLDVDVIMIFIFGFVFFITGYLAGLQEFVVFYVHGLVGAGLMMGTLYTNSCNLARDTALSQYMYILLIVSIVIYAIAAVLYALRKKTMLITKDYNEIYPLLIIAFDFAFIRYIPVIFEYLIRMEII